MLRGIFFYSFLSTQISAGTSYVYIKSNECEVCYILGTPFFLGYIFAAQPAQLHFYCS